MQSSLEHENSVAMLRLAALVSALIAGSCTTTQPRDVADDDCARWFASLGAVIDAAGVHDAQERRINGYPGLRVDRFGAATRDLVGFDIWLDRAAALDQRARDAEVSNLPPATFPIGEVVDAAHMSRAPNSAQR